MSVYGTCAQTCTFLALPPRTRTPTRGCQRQRRAAGEHECGKSYTSGMLKDASLVSFIPVSDIGVARAFYESTLGLAVLEESPFALVVDANANDWDPPFWST